METSLTSSKDYYILSTNIFKMLSLDVSNRHTDGKNFLDEQYSIYIKLMETSNTVEKRIEDKLAPIIVKGKKLVVGVSGADSDDDDEEIPSLVSSLVLTNSSSDGVLVSLDAGMNL